MKHLWRVFSGTTLAIWEPCHLHFICWAAVVIFAIKTTLTAQIVQYVLPRIYSGSNWSIMLRLYLNYYALVYLKVLCSGSVWSTVFWFYLKKCAQVPPDVLCSVPTWSVEHRFYLKYCQLVLVLPEVMYCSPVLSEVLCTGSGSTWSNVLFYGSTWSNVLFSSSTWSNVLFSGSIWSIVNWFWFYLK
jgi:hypothetical protein